MSAENLGKKLKEETAGVRFSRTMFGVSKRLSASQTEKAAGEFDAEAHWLKASKKLLNTRHKAYCETTEVIRRARQIWVDMTVPYPEKGIRLIRKSKIEDLVSRMDACRAELAQKAEALDEQYQEIIAEAKDELGDLFNAGDYPASLGGYFAITLDFPSIEPPNYLQQLSPELYQKQVERIQARFDEAVQLAQDAFATEFHGLLAKLVDRLKPGEGGKSKVFHESTVENLKEFFDKFKALNVGGNEELESLIEKAKGLVAGKTAKDLKDNVILKQEIQEQLQGVAEALSPLVVNKKNRQFDFAEESDGAADAA